MISLLQPLISLSQILWSGPMLLLLLGTHIFFTIRLGFIQKFVFRGIRFSFFHSKESTDSHTSPYAALATSLAATIGTGNIIGISAAIALGGPGAVFWCWITGILGMATCYSECFLSLRYRKKNALGEYIGGPMYLLEKLFHKKHLAIIFSIATVLASFGVGSSVQSNSISSAITKHISISPSLIGFVVAILSGFVIVGGAKQIRKICTFFVPFMSIFYLTGCFWILILNHEYLCSALEWIVKSAFSSRSLAGGMAGTAIHLGIRTGISKGLFTNEAGLGSLPLAAISGSASPIKQSIIAMTGPFWDTVVICAITGLVITSSILKNPEAFQGISMDSLCFSSFEQLPFLGTEILSLSLVLFAFATILGWCYYGECGILYLFGEKGLFPYRVFYLLFVYLGTVVSLDFVWGISDLLNALMALPNLLCLWLLRKKIITPN